MEFFDTYEHAFKSLKFTADIVDNIDETGVYTVVESRNIVVQIGTKQVVQAVSVEREAVITVCMIIISFGNTVPPVFFFPRARLRDSLMFGAPPRSLGLVYSPQSSWITGLIFFRVVGHAKKYTRSPKEDRIILLMESHESHCTLDSVLYARENGIALVTFPPHCSHRLQILDVEVMGPFKGKLRVVQHYYLTANPGNVISHDLASLTIDIYQASFTAKNKTAAFAKPGVWHFSRLAFSDDNFEPSSVTPMEKELRNQEIHVPSASTPIAREISGTSKDSLSPEDLRPFPKPGQRCDRTNEEEVSNFKRFSNKGSH
jgi:hypothetical protein